MALLKCEDCGREVSSRAAACPHCGCPVPQVGPSAVEGSRPGATTAGVGKELPDAWTKPAQPAGAVYPPKTNQSNATVVRALKWIAGLIILLVVIRACSGRDESGPSTEPASAQVPAVSTPPPLPPRPSEADKTRWAKSMADEGAAALTRQKAAQDLVAHFPQTPEGKQAAVTLPVLDKAVAYDAAGRQWRYDSSEEEMGGGSVRTATVDSKNAIDLDFPYAGSQHGRLSLRRHPRWGNDVIFRIERGQILCHSYGDCAIQVRFDDGKVLRYDGNPPEDNSSEVVFIPAFSTFMKQLPRAKVVKIEVSIYQAGNQVFEFDVSGFKPEKLQ